MPDTTRTPWLLALAVAAAALTSTSAATAQDRVIVPGFERGHRHDGFGLRLAAGIGFGRAEATHSDGGPDVELSGSFPSGSVFNIAIGGAIGDNLLLHGTIGGAAIVAPDTTVNGASVSSRLSDDTAVTMVFLGPRLTYYIMPINIYVSGSIGLSGLSWTSEAEGDDLPPYTSADEKTNQASGFAWSAMVGKEWWVSTNWGIGAALHIMNGAASYDEPGDAAFDLTDTSWGFTHFGLLFSATYN